MFIQILCLIFLLPINSQYNTRIIDEFQLIDENIKIIDYKIDLKVSDKLQCNVKVKETITYNIQKND